MTIRPAPYDKDYEITDAMFGAFRLPGGMRSFWKLFLWSTLLYTVISLLVLPRAIGSYANLMMAIFEMEQSVTPDIGALGLGSFFGWVLVIFVAYLVALAVIRAAFFRMYFFGDDGGPVPLRLGGDELRQLLVMLGFFALIFALTFLVSFAASLFMMLLSAVSENSFVGVALGLIVLYGAVIISLVWLGIRLCCAGALTGLRGETHVLAARYVSKNRFWALFGSLLVAGLIGYVASNVGSSIAMMVAFSQIDFNDIFVLLFQGDPESVVQALLRAKENVANFPVMAIAIFIMSAGTVFYSLLIAGPEAFFTRQWAEAGGLTGDEFQG